MDIRVIPQFETYLSLHGCNELRRAALKELQINLGYLCNQACEHCHVEAGPKRLEIMSWETMQKILDWIQNNPIQSIDLTGGAPEMNPHFRQFVDALLKLGVTILSRCNLTILTEPGNEDLAQWYADRNIRLVSSLPCYTQENVDAQRGKGTFGKSITALQKLNAVGYGIDPDKLLNLVYNPGGPFLPPAQASLESDYKARLKADFGIVFSSILTITNLPINRFEHYLKRTHQLHDYIQLLAENFNAETIPGLMCRHLLSVDWTGKIYDCDFNQMLKLDLPDQAAPYLWQIKAIELENQPIAIDKHCFGCTAGAGSSCGGALAD